MITLSFPFCDQIGNVFGYEAEIRGDAAKASRSLA